MLAGVVEWLDRFRLLPNAFSQGLLQTQGSLRDMMFYLAGEQRPGGWWYYFPLAFLIKTPLGILAALVAGVVVGMRHRLAVGRAPAAFITVTATGYLLAAMVVGPNLGVRHILPVYPFILLVAAIAAHHSAATAWFRPRAIAAVCVVVAGVELISVYPHNLTFFNRLVGGPREGFRYLADSNLSWGQNLKLLKQWMTNQRVSTVNLAYFGQAEPGYYDLDCHYLPGSSALTTTHFSRPVLPGFVAISATLLSGLYQSPEWQLLYAPFRERRPSFVVGNSIRVFWVEEWPLSDPGAGDRRDRVTLADALLTLRWYDTAAAYYRQSLAEGDDPDIRIKLALALAGIGDGPAALEQMRLAVAAAPGDGRARLMLASALLGAGDLRGATTEAEAAARLRSGDAATHALLGRIRAMQGQYAGAARALEAALRIEPSRADAQQMLRAVEAALRSGQG
jgi:hypothetical protein